ncbi:unnamed protein product [Caenorhabditis brenneri]
MSKDLVPPTPDTFPTFINQKLKDLDLMPKKTDLDVIRALLYMVQEERALSHEELQDWKKTEKEVLKDQNTYKKRTENMIKAEKCSIYFCVLFVLPISYCFYVLTKVLDDETCKVVFKCGWIINLIAMVVYFFYLTGFNIRLGFVIPKSVKASENESSHWQNSMTTTELQSRQKAFVSEWEELVKEVDDHPLLDLMSFLALLVNIGYFVLRFAVIQELVKEKSTPSLSRVKDIFLLVDCVITFVFFSIFTFQLLLLTSLSPRDL